MKPIIILAVCLGLVVQECRVAAQVPHILTYQGRVASGGIDFNGVGQFKFALVSGATSTAAQATASATVSFGFLVQITVTSGGAGYAAAPAVTITDSSGSGASAVAQIANGQVVGITVTDAGSGYSASPAITIAPPAMNLSYATYWSHDGTSSAGGEPASVVPVSVSQGLFTVGLGDTMIPNMGVLAPQVFANSDVRLRIWFNDGVNGFHQLSPDQRLTSSAYAMMADTVRDGAITAAKLAPGSVGVAQLADGAITTAKLATNSNIATPSGSIVLSQEADATNLLSAGYVRMLGAKVVTEEWEIIATRNSVPIGSFGASAVLIGNEMVFLGDYQFPWGARYVFSSNTWLAITPNNAPEPRAFPTLVWTGSKVIMWGGSSYDGNPHDVASGGVFDPTTDVWYATSMSNAPTPRSGHVAVWTGSEMIIWSGSRRPTNNVPYTYFNDGARYNPIMNRWLPMATANAPSPRQGSFAVWTGSEMIVWGGNGTNSFADNRSGGRYNPASDTWLPIAAPAFPQPNGDFASIFSEIRGVVWTGSEVAIWNSERGLGAFYNTATGNWRPMNPSGPRNGGFSATLMGNKIVYLLYPDVPSASYNLATDEWSFFSSPNGITSEDRYNTAVVGESLFVINIRNPGSVAKYTPKRPLYLYQKP